MAPQANNLDQGEENVAHAAALLRQGLPATSVERRALRDRIGPLGPRTRRILQSDRELAQALWLLELAIRQDQTDRRTTRGQWVLPAIMGCALLGLIGFLLLLSAKIASASSPVVPDEDIRPRRAQAAQPPANPHRTSSLTG